MSILVTGTLWLGGIMVAILLPIVLIGRWILSPIDRAAKDRQAPTRFSMGDFLCLFLAVQLPLTAVYRLIEEEEKRLFWLFTILTWCIAPVIWLACTSALSRAGVRRSVHRFAFIGLIMPIVYYGLVPFAMLTCWALINLLFSQPPPLAWKVEATAAIWLVLAAAFYLSGVYTRHIVKHAGAEEAAAEMNEPLSAAREHRTEGAGAIASASGDHIGKSGPPEGSMSASGQPSHLGAARLQ